MTQNIMVIPEMKNMAPTSINLVENFKYILN